MKVYNCRVCDKECPKPKRGGQNSMYCSECRAEKERIRSRKDCAKKRLRRSNHLNHYKLKKGCELCQYKDNVLALHWDHINPQDKTNNVTTFLNASLKNLFKELRKCRILCANCHAIHTYSNRHSWRDRQYPTLERSDL